MPDPWIPALLRRHVLVCLLVLSGLALTACGGGGGGGGGARVTSFGALGAEFVSNTIPAGITKDTGLAITVTVKNTGTIAWNTASVHLEATATNQLVWSSFGSGGASSGPTNQRVDLAGTVNPGSELTLSFSIEAGATVGTKTVSARMRNNTSWFGPTFSIDTAVTAGSGGGQLGATFGTHTIPASVIRNTVNPITVKVKNTGSTTWSTSSTHLEAAATNQLIWSGFVTGGSSSGVTSQSADLPEDIAPGGEVTLRFSIAAGATVGTKRFAARMRDGTSWFGPTLSVSVEVQAGGGGQFGSTFVSNTIPTTMTKDAARLVRVTIKNSGDTTWSTSSTHLEATASNQLLWSNFGNGGSSNGATNQKVNLGTAVQAGNEVTLSFSIHAGAALGTKVFSARMRDGSSWFGPTLSVSIGIQAGSQWSDNFDSYAANSQVVGQGGWEEWGPGTGALVSSARSRSTPNSIDIVGASDLVHRYSGYTSGTWEYSARQYIPRFTTGTQYFILLSQYGITNKWAVQVAFNPATGNVEADAGGGQATNAGLYYDRWVQIRVLIHLDEDWVQFYYNGVLLDSATVPDHPVLGGGWRWTYGPFGKSNYGGLREIGAVDLYANSATSVYYDDLSLTKVSKGGGRKLGSPTVIWTAASGQAACNLVGDVNADGRNDIVTSHAGGGLYWLENRASGWVPHAITNGGAIHEIAVEDLDLDGDLDIVSVSARGTGWPGSCCGGEVRAYWNDGTGKFTSTQVSTVVDGGRGVKCGDLDGDGWPEIIWTYREFGSRSVHFVRNQGSGRFGNAQVIGYVPEAHDIELSDVDLDGDLDVLVGGFRASAPTLFVNQWPWWFERTLPGSESGVHFLWVADLDNDGDQEVITRSVHPSPGGAASWRENQGGRSFASTTGIYQGLSYVGGAVLDLDLDGDLDFVGGNSSFVSSPQLVWWQNLGGSFAAAVPLGVASQGTSFFAGDLDSDGDEDLIFDAGGAVTVVMNLVK